MAKNLENIPASPAGPATTGLMLSGGIDSAILLATLVRSGRQVVPFYVRTGCIWENAELLAVRRILATCEGARVADLVEIDMPLSDVYDGHWSMTGQGVPDARSPNSAVFLPGRNPLLLVKPLVWCQQRGVRQLALATLDSNPFADATADFFEAFAEVMGRATGRDVKIIRPFESLSKQSVLEQGRKLPLELTFSCLSPVDDLHCGKCNKCAERRTAFARLELRDPTRYASEESVASA